MDKFELREGDLYLGDHEMHEILDDSSVFSSRQRYMDTLLENFFRGREDYRRFIDLYGRVNGLERCALLEAHGNTNGDWVYQDNGKTYRVQTWVNSVDGKYSALLLCVCNPGTHTPKSKKSVLMIPDDIIEFIGSGGTTPERNVCFDLYVPKKGLLDSYTIGYEIKQLEKSLQK